MKAKLLIFIALFILLAGGGYVLLNNKLQELTQPGTQEPQALQADGIEWYQDSAKNFSLAIFDKPLEFMFTAKNAQNIKEQAFLTDMVLAVNGSFFRGSYVDAEHAGLLQIKGEQIEPIVTGDAQVTHVLVYDHESEQMHFEAVEGFEAEPYAQDNFTLMQTGPLLIEDNVVQTELIATSLNGDGRYLRTAIGYTDSGKKFVLISRVNFTLPELAEKLLSLPPFAGVQINVVNLDGGTSTAMYSQSLEQFNFGTSKRLPVIIGVK